MREHCPKLRTDIEVIPTIHEGNKGFLIRDSLGLIEKPLLLQGEILEILGLLDGEKTITDLQLILMRQRGKIFVSGEQIKELISELDSFFLLDNERYRNEKERIISEYSLLGVRKAFHAGRSYPNEPEELRTYLDSILNIEIETPSNLKDKKILALVAPHIDLEVGKRIFAKAYSAVKNSSPERIILLGTGHNLHEPLFSLTEKDFETPLGRVKTDTNWVRKLKETAGKVTTMNDIVHRSEHSLEFQLVFLQYLFGNDFLLLPILCGSFHSVLEKNSRPSEISGMKDFFETLRIVARDNSTKTLLLAGVDFSHVGPKFGHNQRASSKLLETEHHDKLLIDDICQGNVEAFWEHMRRSQGQYNVCGFSAIAALLEILKDAQGHLIDYEIWLEEPTQSAVSFAAIAFEA